METLDLFPFQWPRPPAAGFRWVPSAAADISRGPWLVADLLALERAERYEPTRVYPGLFRSFATLLEATD